MQTAFFLLSGATVALVMAASITMPRNDGYKIDDLGDGIFTASFSEGGLVNVTRIDDIKVPVVTEFLPRIGPTRRDMPITRFGCYRESVNQGDWENVRTNFKNFCDGGAVIPGGGLQYAVSGKQVAFACSWGGNNPCSGGEFDEFLDYIKKNCGGWYGGWVDMDSWAKQYAITFPSALLLHTRSLAAMKLLNLAFLTLAAGGALAAPAASAEQVASVGLRSRSPEFFQAIHDMINSTAEEDGFNIEKRGTTTLTSSKDGVNAGGFYYSVYSPNGATVKYTSDDNSGAWGLDWTCKAEFLAGKGYRSTTPRSLTYSGSFKASGDWTLAAYGWTTNPVTEWYVVDAHGSGTPGNGKPVGTVTSDSGTYDVYDLYYSNVPEIYGATSFHQYWSVRRAQRTTGGTINVAKHFSGWKSLGLKPGAPVFQMLTLEGFSGSGSLSFKTS
ncbi:putative endo-1,4-beta-xylanase A [Colletotrichum fructicola]|nr:putative endo-1,4-beta-xylanase A [Colletotrichum fructicola]